MKHFIQTHVKWVLAVFIAGIALAGCGANTEKANSSEAQTGAGEAQAGASEVKTDSHGANHNHESEKTYELKVGYLKGQGAPLLDIAQHEGFFEAEKLKVEGVSFASSADGLNALQAGKIDVGITFGTAAPLTFISKGSDFAIIGGHLEGGHPILTQQKDKDKYKTLEDYKGKKVGTIRMFTSDIVFRSALADAGIDWKTDLEIVEFKTPGDLLQAISSGKVDVAISANTTLLQAIKQDLAIVGWSNDLNPSHVCCRVVTRKELLSEDEGEAYKRLLKAFIRAERVKNEHPEKAVAAAKIHLKLDDETVDSIVNEEHSHYSPDPNSKEILKMWEQMKEIGYLENVDGIDIRDYIILDLYERALEELIAEYPNDQDYYQQLLDRFNQQNI
jgi:NitT/TauT family transport system substrate-binding protein